MTTNILEHLENIKIFTDYKKSGLSTVEAFWDYVEKGNNPEKIHEKILSFRIDREHFDYDPSKEEINRALEERERFKNTDWVEVYSDYVRSRIETSLNYDSAEFQQVMRLDEIYSKIIVENPNLKEYLATSEDIFLTYSEILGNDLPSKFFSNLAQYERARETDSKRKLVHKEDSITIRNKKIDWLNVFEEIDIEKDIKRQVYKTTTHEQKENYFSKASFNLTLQYLQHFKKQTEFLSDERRLTYIKALNIAPPKTSNTESPTFNQTVFEAQSNYYDFLKAYQNILREKGKLQNMKEIIFKKDMEIEKGVRKAFDFMLRNDPRKHRQILTENDFDNLIKWVSYYFNNDFQLPIIEQPIKEVNTAKGNVIITFKYLFKNLHPTKPYPNSLFQLYRMCFLAFRNDKMSNFLKQKEPQYYKLLFKKESP